MKDETGNFDEPDKEKCLRKIEDSLEVAKDAYYRVESIMRKYYDALDGN